MYSLSKLKFSYILIKNFLLRMYYRVRYDIFFDDAHTRGSLLPNTGENDFVKVEQKGRYLDIEQKQTKRLIRMIPSKHSNGYMVEFYEGGVEGGLIHRGQMSFNEIWKHYIDEEEN